jgi:glycosyltransferase involved in cell wall biosynthesis
MKVLIELTYYRPHTSGLTIYAERLAKALAKRGHSVTVLTSRYDKRLPKNEIRDGVQIIRVPVLFRISKGVIMPTFGYFATRLALENDVIHLHLPQFDAVGLALRGRLFKKPIVITYHCDLQMPKGLLNWAANQAVHLMNFLACFFTDRIVTYTQDYADHSTLLRRFSKKIAIIDPPVELPEINLKEVQSFEVEYNPDGHHPIIGIAARFATEKGIEILTTAMDGIVKTFPDAVVWFAGPYKNILGEEEYFGHLIPKIKELEKNGNWKFLGLLSPERMAAFYPNIDMLVIPSLNSTEAFGLVQIEAMINGKPSIASDLPGVRQPVLRHMMGRVIPIGDADALAKAVIDIWKTKKNFKKSSSQIKKQYSPDSIAAKFEMLFEEIKSEKKK